MTNLPGKYLHILVILTSCSWLSCPSLPLFPLFTDFTGSSKKKEVCSFSYFEKEIQTDFSSQETQVFLDTKNIKIDGKNDTVFWTILILNYQSLHSYFKHFSSAERFWSFIYASKFTHRAI